jgi:hypothetical protein
MVIKIFSDRSCIPDGKGHVTMLYPFWGKNPEDPRDPFSGRFDRYTEIGSRFFECTSLQDADLAVLPVAWEHVLDDKNAIRQAEAFIEKARQAGKPVVIFFWSDSDEPLPYENTVVFRTSSYRSRRRFNEFALPAWSEDFARYFGGKLSLRPKQGLPVVGFCGYAPVYRTTLVPLHKRMGNLLRLGYTIVGSRKGWKGLKYCDSVARAMALQALMRSPFIERKIIIRDAFYGAGRDYALLEQLRNEYVQNMVESDYVLCAKGGGNFSYRLYETLSCGRIPVFIDTDCLLPYQDEIDWKEYCMWVGVDDCDFVAERIAEFHNALSPTDFIEVQKRCRKLWEDWLSPEGFFSNFYRHFLHATGEQNEEKNVIGNVR